MNCHHLVLGIGLLSFGSVFSEEVVIDLELKPNEKVEEALVEKKVEKGEIKNSFNKSHWLTELLKENMNSIESHPQLQSHKLNLEQIELNVLKAESNWNPDLSVGKNISESQKLSFSRVDGAGSVTNENDRTTIDLGKNYDFGSRVNLQVAQNESDSSSADRLSRETVNSSMTLSVTQKLLKGRGRLTNRFEITELEYNKLNEENKRRVSIENQLIEFGRMSLELAEAKATIKTRKAHLQIAIRERETERARVEEGLSARRKLLSHQRNVLDLELKLGTIERRLSTLEKDFLINWPGLNELSDVLLKELTETDFKAELKPSYDYDLTRSGKDWQEKLSLDEKRIAVMSLRKQDELNLQLSYNQNGVSPDQSDSWELLKEGDAKEWRVGLTYKHTFGKNRDRLNFYSSKVRQNQNIELYKQAVITWQRKRSNLAEDYHNAVDNMKERHLLLEIQEREKELLNEELNEGLVRLEEVFNADKALLNAKLSMITQRKQQRLIDLQLRAHDENLMELIP